MAIFFRLYNEVFGRKEASYLPFILTQFKKKTIFTYVIYKHTYGVYMYMYT